jgi:hypothetical protein
MSLKQLRDVWNQLFFDKKPAEGIAIFRILLGLLTLFTFFQDVLRLEDFWGPNAIQSVETGMKNYNFPILSIFQHFTMSYNLLYTFITVQFISLICFTLGYKTRIFSILSFILIVSFQQRNVNMLSSADLLLRILFMIVMFAPTANVFSLDSLIARIKGKPLPRDVSPWAHRLIQIQIAVVYISTVIAKSKGITWLDGSAVYYSTRLIDLTRFPVPFLLDWKWFLILSTWLTLITELSLGTLIFIKEFKKPLILIGIIFHLGIEYMMSIPTFEIIMIIGLLTMFDLEDYRNYLGQFKNYSKKKYLTKLKEGKLKKIIERCFYDA